MTSGSTSSTLSSSSGSQKQASTAYGLSQGHAGHYDSFQTQGKSAAPVLTVKQQATEGATTANGSSTGSQSQSLAIIRLFSRYVGSHTK